MSDISVRFRTQACPRKPLSHLAPTLFPFFRHTISNVRLAVVKTLYSFMSVSSLPRDWLTVDYLRLLFQNLVVEERTDIRDATLDAWRLVFDILSAGNLWLQTVVTQQLLLGWYEMMMVPLGQPMSKALFYDPAATSPGADLAERHNVDKNMLAQDLTLVPIEIVIQARVASAQALAYVTACWPESVSCPHCYQISFADQTHREMLTRRCYVVHAALYNNNINAIFAILRWRIESINATVVFGGII